MRTFFSIVCAAIMLLTGTHALAGYKPGDEVKSFTLLNVDGKKVSLDDHKRAKGCIIIFTCNHCPFAKLYQQRINELNTKYKPMGMPVLAISSNDAGAVPEDNYDEMVKRAKEEAYNFPYLYDSTQAIARAFGAAKTPQAFVLFKEGGKWIVRYSGAIDDNGAEPEKVKNHFVINAVDALLQNKPVTVTTTRSVGCAIKWRP